MTRSLFVGCLIAPVVLAACGSEPTPAIQVGDISWAEDELLGLSMDRRRELAGLTALAMAVSDGTLEEAMAPAIDQDLQRELAVQAALEAHLQTIGADEQQLRTYYESNPQWELTVRHILFFSERFESDEQRAAARTKAQAALERIRAGDPFPEVAAELSEEPGAEGRQGLLTPGREGSWVPEFWQAALGLDVGEISRVTETQYGFHVLRLEDRQIVPFEEARPSVARAVASLGSSIDVIAGEWLMALEDEIVLHEDEIAALVQDPTISRRLLAEWPEGSIDDEYLLEYLATDPEAAGFFDSRDLDVVAEIIRELARRELSTDRARTLGATIPPAIEAEIREDWAGMFYRWTSTFGLQEAVGTETIKASARGALELTGQAANIARSEVKPFGGILTGFYGVSLEETGN